MTLPAHLHTITQALSDAEIRALRRGTLSEQVEEAKTPLFLRTDGTPIRLRPMYEALVAGADREWGSIPESDGWLAVRLHATLRLTRRQAGDGGLWEWLAQRLSGHYVEWRWADADGMVPKNRYRGAINKQAFARLWWGAELFRNGDDYQPVLRMFRNQDYPNSYLHRAFTRNRPLSLAILTELDQRTGGQPTSDQINDVARLVNLWLTPLSLEDLTEHWHPDASAYNEWAMLNPTSDLGESAPTGPPDGRVPDSVLAMARRVAADICDLAEIGV